jgi:hypothetical protein
MRKRHLTLFVVKLKQNAGNVLPVSWQTIKDNFVGGCERVLFYNYTFTYLFLMLCIEFHVARM